MASPQAAAAPPSVSQTVPSPPPLPPPPPPPPPVVSKVQYTLSRMDTCFFFLFRFSRSNKILIASILAIFCKLEEKKPSEKGVLVPNAKLDEQPDISHFESVPFFFFLAEKELALNFNSS